MMPNVAKHRRTDTASRLMMASPETIYRSLLDPDAVATWRPPAGMRCDILAFDPHPGGEFRMSLTYTGTDHGLRGKTSDHADVVHGRFTELVPNQRIVEVVEFESNDPAFAGAMTIITTLTEVSGATNVTIACENVPKGISPSDHQLGLRSSLENLAAFTESRRL
jgi:uncharacterized protein YndB with AHSA1/START domain